MSDIDIDFANRDEILKLIKHVPACIKTKNTYKKHNSGVYCQSIPVNPLSGYCSLDYKEAETRGYFKIDFLNVGIYKDIKSEKHLDSLLKAPPIWELLKEKEICDQLFHINGHHELIKELNPTSISELAMVLAMIRPGKKHLIQLCKEQGYAAIANEIWKRPADDTYYFKKSHSIGYAHLIVMQLNHICEKLSNSLFD